MTGTVRGGRQGVRSSPPDLPLRCGEGVRGATAMSPASAVLRRIQDPGDPHYRLHTGDRRPLKRIAA